MCHFRYLYITSVLKNDETNKYVYNFTTRDEIRGALTAKPQLMVTSRNRFRFQFATRDDSLQLISQILGVNCHFTSRDDSSRLFIRCDSIGRVTCMTFPAIYTREEYNKIFSQTFFQHEVYLIVVFQTLTEVWLA